ncbi:diguanylate cyclase domain-containing protein [Cognatiluteimonas profundi]|uniref:diguanylate cyclase domain-containing protein n=1 Tax=Cognatiluteimonas profundi TaxID=2594501 RepID=UPI00131BC757|nr:diguanylate cyclase [Lysobacter profundi]
MIDVGETMPAGSDSDIEETRETLADLKREVAELQQQWEFSHSALRAMPDGVVIVGAQGRIDFINPVAAHLTGWTEADLIGRKFDEGVHFTDPQGTPIDVLNTSGRDIAGLMRRDEHVVLVEAAVAPVVDSARKHVGSIITFRNVTAARRLTNELTYHANHDALTGLDNRRAFEFRLERAVANAAEQGSRHSLLYFDLDFFKAVNDQAGHVAGDELLRQLAAVLRKQLRDSDMLARLGGDEFAVLLSNCTRQQAACASEKIRSAVATFTFLWEGAEFRIGASIGRVDFRDGAMTVSELLVHADEMCYLAKTSGRNQVKSYEPQRDRSLHQPGAGDSYPRALRPAESARRS